MQCGSGVDLSDVGRVNREPRRIVMFVLMFNPEKKIVVAAALSGPLPL